MILISRENNPKLKANQSEFVSRVFSKSVRAIITAHTKISK
jgi:hypothetical protein